MSPTRSGVIGASSARLLNLNRGLTAGAHAEMPFGIPWRGRDAGIRARHSVALPQLLRDWRVERSRVEPTRRL